MKNWTIFSLSSHSSNSLFLPQNTFLHNQFTFSIPSVLSSTIFLLKFQIEFLTIKSNIRNITDALFSLVSASSFSPPRPNVYFLFSLVFLHSLGGRHFVAVSYHNFYAALFFSTHSIPGISFHFTFLSLPLAAASPSLVFISAAALNDVCARSSAKKLSDAARIEKWRKKTQ